MRLLILNKHELAMGIAKESSEHGMSYDEARKTAIDHLKERPDYYSVADKAGLEEDDALEEWHDSIFTKGKSGSGRAGRVKKAINKAKKSKQFAPSVYPGANYAAGQH